MEKLTEKGVIYLAKGRRSFKREGKKAAVMPVLN